MYNAVIYHPLTVFTLTVAKIPCPSLICDTQTLESYDKTDERVIF